MKTNKQITHWLSVIVIGIALGLGLQFVRAWTEPTTAPPNGNVGAPINTSVNPQTKSGGLNIGGKLKVGNDAQPQATGQIRWNEISKDFEGFDGTVWKSFTAQGGGGGTLDPCTVTGPYSQWAEDWLLVGPWDLTIWNSWATQYVFFTNGASAGTFTDGSAIHISDIRQYFSNGENKVSYSGPYDIYCRDGKWAMW